MKEFIFILACVFCIFQCENDETITETRILQFDEIEAPEEVLVSSEVFEIILKNICDDDEEDCHISSLGCKEYLSWVTDRKNNKLELTPQGSYSYQRGNIYRCLAEGISLEAITYQVQGPFEIGDFRIIVRGSQTLEKVVKIVE